MTAHNNRSAIPPEIVAVPFELPDLAVAILDDHDIGDVVDHNLIVDVLVINVPRRRNHIERRTNIDGDRNEYWSR